jgi:hypothetical protein
MNACELQESRSAEPLGSGIRALVLCVAALAVFRADLGWAQSPSPAMVLVVNESSVSARMASRGGKLVLFGLAHEEKNYITTLVRRDEILEDTDQDGVVSFDLGRPVPVASIWIGIDLQTGDSVVAAPTARPRRELPLPVRVFAPNLRRLDLDLRMAELLLVHPGLGGAGAGAFGLLVGDGGESDEDGEQNETLQAVLADMRSLGDSPVAPLELLAGDVLVVVDPLDLRVLVVRVAAAGGIAQ